MSSENQYVLVLWTSPGRGTNANEADDWSEGKAEQLHFLQPTQRFLPAGDLGSTHPLANGGEAPEVLSRTQDS